ncbi:MAG: hypothetical protein RR190_03690, partial [Bacteroidales bacterium]
VVVAYHARAGAMEGMLEMYEVDATGFKAGLGQLRIGARINNITTDNSHRIFASIDTKDGPVVAVIAVKNGSFIDKTSIEYIRLGGESANGVLYTKATDGNEYLFTATGGDGQYNSTLTDSNYMVYNFDRTHKLTLKEFRQNPGFQKIKISGQTLTPISFQGNPNNRGKWIASDGKSFVTLHLSKFNTLPYASVQYYDSFINQFHQRAEFPRIAALDNQTNLQGKNVALLPASTDVYNRSLYLCLENKGFQSFTISLAGAQHIDTYVKPTVAAIQGENDLFYLACGKQGVQVIKSTQGMLTPLKSYTYTADKNASANFVALQGNCVYIAYGTAGLIAIDKDAPLFIAD